MVIIHCSSWGGRKGHLAIALRELEEIYQLFGQELELELELELEEIYQLFGQERKKSECQ